VRLKVDVACKQTCNQARAILFHFSVRAARIQALIQLYRLPGMVIGGLRDWRALQNALETGHRGHRGPKIRGVIDNSVELIT